MTLNHAQDAEVKTVPLGPAVIVAILAGAYIAAQMLSNISSLHIVEVVGWKVDAGTLIYPITFTLRDLVHKTTGKRVAQVLILAAAAANLFMAGLFWVIAHMPVDPTMAQPPFGAVLSPVWRIVFASIFAEIISELIDTEIYARWALRFGERFQWGRVLSSNSVAVPIDSAIFIFTAFIGVYSLTAIWQIFVVNIIAKGLVTVVSIPLIYTVRPQLRVEPSTKRSPND